MLAKQAATHKEIFCTSDLPLPEVFQMMSVKKCPCIPIVESLAHKNIIGAVTEHDICLKTITDGLNPQRLSAGRVMNGNITTVNCEATIEECAELMKLTGAERLFVVDENGGFCGILTESELKPDILSINLETVITDLPIAPALPQKFYPAY